MSSPGSIWPEEVEVFLHGLGMALEFHGATLQEVASGIDSIRAFKVAEAEVETWLTLLRSAPSPDGSMPTYRALANSTFSPNEQRDLTRSEIGANRLPTMGAVCRDRRMLSSQGLIEPGSAHMLGAVMATAMMQSAPSILDGLRRQRRSSMPAATDGQQRGEAAAFPAPEPESVWTQSEFERIQSDLAHLGGGELGDRALRFFPGDGVTLSLSAANDHPYFGGGLLSRLTVPVDDFVVDGTLVPVEFINSVTILGGKDPAFGAWMAEEDTYNYVTFLPNHLMSLPCFEAHWVSWSLSRAMHVQGLAETGHWVFLKLGS